MGKELDRMTEYPAKLAPDRCPVHPGAVLADIIPDVGKSKSEIARVLGISRQYLHDILEARKPLSPAMAVRIAKAFGGSAGSWLRMQASHDAWRAERDVDVSGIPALRAA
jgi:addiction module HigA family antidote